MKEIKGEIISIGTELLLGQISNTNAMWLSDQMSAYGINVFYHTVAGDNVERVHRIFSQAQKRSNLVLVTGGLGPTEDDMTREAFQKLTKLSMYEDQLSLKKIKTYFQNNKQFMTPNNRKQALVFETAKVLVNKTGMAPGMIVNFQNTTWIFLPGVPKEMKTLFYDEVSPFLYELTDKKEIIKSKMLRFVGIGEAELEHKLFDLIQSQSNPTLAPLAQDEGVALRITVKARSKKEAADQLEKAKEKILEIVKPYYFGEETDSLSKKIIGLLKEHNYTLASAESLTGGLFASELIGVEGASSVIAGSIVAYDSAIKEKVLQVSKDTILNYGVVSEQCAIEMAKNIRKIMNTSLGISFTGVAGPKSLEGKNVGRVFIGVSNEESHKAFSYSFSGDRNKIRKKSLIKGLEILFKMLN